jgi:FkbM family methyltransferase
MSRHSNLAPRIEQFAQYVQGKGYNSDNLADEIRNTASLLTESPSLIIDIGGNVGNYTAAVLQIFPDVELHVFEPSAKNVQILKNKFKDSKNVNIVPNAITNDTNLTKLFSNEIGSGLASLTKRNLEYFNIEFNKIEEISPVKFSDYWKNDLNEKVIDIVKIDIEGHELDALQSFGESLQSIKVIQFEFGGTSIDTRNYFQDYWRLFSKNNFSIYRITPHGLLSVPQYSENLECFLSMNYVAANKKFIK